MYVDRRLLTHFEWVLPLFAMAVCALGIVTVYSATHGPEVVGPSTLAMRQGTWFVGGLVGMLLAVSFDYRRLDRYAYVVYGTVLVALVLVPLVGRVGGGSRRWITLGPVSLQPSEFMKPALVIALAHHFARTLGGTPGLPRDDRAVRARRATGVAHPQSSRTSGPPRCSDS
jgi:rod shape determining protein RodA